MVPLKSGECPAASGTRTGGYPKPSASLLIFPSWKPPGLAWRGRCPAQIGRVPGSTQDAAGRLA